MGIHNSEEPQGEEQRFKKPSAENFRDMLDFEGSPLAENNAAAVYETMKPYIRNGLSEEEVGQFLLRTFSPTLAAGMFAEDGFVNGSITIAKTHGVLDVSQTSIKSGYTLAKSKIGHGISEDNLVQFLLLGLSTKEAAETLAQDGLMGSTTRITEAYGLHELSAGSIEKGYAVGKGKIRNGISEETAARFLLLSPERRKYYRIAAEDGFMMTAYFLKIKCNIDEILPHHVVDSLLEKQEGRQSLSFSNIAHSAFETIEMAQGDVPRISPEMMLEEIAGNNAEFKERFRLLMQKNDSILQRKMREREDEE